MTVEALRAEIEQASNDIDGSKLLCMIGLIRILHYQLDELEAILMTEAEADV